MSERDGYNHLYLYTLNGTLVRQLTKGKFVVSDYYGTDGKYFYYAANDGNPLEKYIYKVDMNGKSVRITENKGWNSATFSKGCRYFVNVFSDINTPSVTSLYTSAGKQLKVLEDNAELKSMYSSLGRGSQEFFTFTTSEGISLNGWMVKPADFSPSKKYPVIMYQYSGPGDQQVRRTHLGTATCTERLYSCLC